MIITFEVESEVTKPHKELQEMMIETQIGQERKRTCEIEKEEQKCDSKSSIYSLLEKSYCAGHCLSTDQSNFSESLSAFN